MKIEIELKPGTARRIGGVAATLVVLGVGAAVHASQAHFSSGQALTAAALNGNFDELYAAAAKPTITRGGKSISVGGAYCGASETPVDGATVGGYTGAKATCETTCTSATAHICDAAEIIRSQQLGVTIPSQRAWIDAPSDSNPDVLNCQGWTITTGAGFVSTLSRISSAPCSTALPIACCD